MINQSHLNNRYRFNNKKSKYPKLRSRKRKREDESKNNHQTLILIQVHHHHLLLVHPHHHLEIDLNAKEKIENKVKNIKKIRKDELFFILYFIFIKKMGNFLSEIDGDEF